VIVGDGDRIELAIGKYLRRSGGWRPCGDISLGMRRDEYWRSQLANRRSTLCKTGRTSSV